MTRTFSSAFRLSAGFAARAAAIAILIAALAGVASAEQLSLSPTSLLFAAQAGSTTAQTQSVTVLSSGNNIYWYAQLPVDRPAWLTTISPAIGVTSTNPLTVTVNPTSLAAGSYSTTVQVWSPYSTNAPNSTSPLSLTVTLIVGGTGTITADKSALTFTATTGGANPATQTVRVTTASSSSIVATPSISYTSGAGWLSVSPTSGTLSSGAPLDLTVTATTGSLATNSYVAALTISSGSNTQTVSVRFDVLAGSIISASPNPVNITAVFGSTTTVTQTLVVTNSSAGSVTVTPSISAGPGWLSQSTGAVAIPANSTGNITLQANPTNLGQGTSVGQVTLTPSPTGNVITVPVNFAITATSTLTLNKSSMLFSTSASQSDTFAMSNSSASGIDYNITWQYQQGSGWLSLNTTVGNVPGYGSQTVTATANALGLGTGNYNATISVTAGGQTQTISVTLSVGGAVAISASPTSLAISSGVGSQATGAVTISSTSAATVSLTGGSSITCTSPYTPYCATASPASDIVQPGVPRTFTITSWFGLAQGTYSATLNFQSSVGGSISVPLTINVGTGGSGAVTVYPSAPSFSAAVGGGVQSQQLSVSSGTSGYYNAQVTQGGTWLSVGYQGSTFNNVYVPGPLSVFANPATLSAGTYYGTIAISGAGGTQSVFVTFVVGGGGTGTGLTVSPAALPVSAAAGGQSAPQTVNVYGSTQTYFFASVQGNSPWLILTQPSGTTPGSITLYANAASLTAGTYYGQINVTSSLGTQTVTVTLTVGGGGTGNVSATPSALSFVTPVGGTPSQQSVVISASGAAFTATAATTTGGNWLSVSPASGSSGATLNVSVTNPGLAAGAYSGQINIASVYGNLSVQVTLTVGGTPGAITANPVALQFTAAAGGGIPAAQSVTLTTSSSSADYTIGTVPSWMSVTPPAGTITPTSPGSLTVYVQPGSLAAGTYNGSIVIVGGGGSAIVQVTFTVGGGGGGTGGGLTASPGSLTMSSPLGSTSTVQQYISLSGYLAFSAYATTSSGSGWLSVTPASGTAPANLYVQANPAVVAAGSYSGSIVVYTAQGSLMIPVTFNVGTSGGGGVIQVSTSSLSFSGQTGGTAPVAQYLTVTSSTGYSTSFSATAAATSGGSWLSVTPSSSVTPVTLTVAVNPAGLAAGGYYGTVTLFGSDGYSQQTVQVTLTLTSANLTVAPASLAFTAATGGSAAPQTLSVSSVLGSIPFSASASVTSGGAWLAVSPNTGNTTSSLTATVNLSGLNPGSYTGSITISSGVGTANVPVTLTVTQQVNLAVTPETLAFEALTGAASIPTKTVNVSVSTGSLNFTATAATTSGGSSWLQVTPASGMTPGTLTVAVSATGLNPGVFNGTVTVSAAGASNSPRVIQVTLTITSPAPVITAVQNAAAGPGGILAAGTIVSIYGTALASETAAFPQIVSGGLVPTLVGDVRVLFDGIAGPILYAQARQVNTVIPWSLFGRTTVRVEVEYKGNRSAAVQIQLYDAAPGIFSIGGTGTGQGAILNQDGSVNSTANGAAADSFVAMYATGMGQTEPQGVDGAFPTQILPKPMLPVTVLVGNSEADVTYAGAAPYLVSGAMQVNVRIPRGLQPGAYALTLRIGRFSSQIGVTIVVK